MALRANDDIRGFKVKALSIKISFFQYQMGSVKRNLVPFAFINVFFSSFVVINLCPVELNTF